MTKSKRSRWAVVPLLAALAAAFTALAACSGNGGASPTTASVHVHISAGDRAWLFAAHQADLAEMSAGALGQAIGGSPQIRAAASAMVTDHSAFDLKLVKVAEALGFATVLPHHMTLFQSETADQLAKEQGPTFDHDFTASMMAAHQQLIAATKAEIAHGSAPPIVNLAKQALPMLDKHLAMLKAAASTG